MIPRTRLPPWLEWAQRGRTSLEVRGRECRPRVRIFGLTLSLCATSCRGTSTSRLPFSVPPWPAQGDLGAFARPQALVCRRQGYHSSGRFATADSVSPADLGFEPTSDRGSARRWRLGTDRCTVAHLEPGLPGHGRELAYAAFASRSSSPTSVW